MTQNVLETYLQNLVTTTWKLETSKSMKRVWQSHDIATDIKVRLWKVRQAMACWHLRMRILDHWITKTSDESRIRSSIWTERVKASSASMMDNMKSQRLTSGSSKKKFVSKLCFWYAMRHSSLEKDIIQRSLSGSRKRGRAQTTPGWTTMWRNAV